MSPPDRKYNLGPYLGDAVYGALDGTVTTFAVMAGAIGAHLSTSAIIILGLANLFADGFSMAVGSYLSQKSRNQYIQQQLNLTRQSIKDHDPRSTYQVKQLYLHKGFRGHVLEHVMQVLQHHPESLAREALQATGIETTMAHPFKSSLVTYVAFLFIGFMPILPLIIMPSLNFWTIFLFVGSVLFVVGTLRSRLTAVSWYRGGAEIMFAGLVASLIAYGVGLLLSSLI